MSEANGRKLEAKYRENKDDLNALKDLVVFYLQQGTRRSLERASTLIDSAEGEFEDSADFNQLAGLTYMRMDIERAGKLAIACGTKCIELEPKNPKRYAFLGYVYWWYGQLDDAIQSTEKALQLARGQEFEKHNALSKGNLAYYYAQAGIKNKKRKALDYAEYSYRYFKGDATRADTSGYVKMKFSESAQDLEEAERYFRKARKEKGALVNLIDKHLRELDQKKKMYKSKT